MSYDNTNTGALFVNDRRKTDKHPNYSGSINFQGTDYFLSGWVKKNDDGSFKLMSLAVGEAKQKQSGQQGYGGNKELPETKKDDGGFGLDSDVIPFMPLRELP